MLHALCLSTFEIWYEIWGQGCPPNEIASRLNIPLGEIELVIKLRKYLNSPIKEKL